MNGEIILVWISIVASAVTLLSSAAAFIKSQAITKAALDQLRTDLNDARQTNKEELLLKQKAIDALWSRSEVAAQAQVTRLDEFSKGHTELKICLATMAGDIKGINIQLTQVVKDRDLSGILIDTLQKLSK